jgi:hypothetical protein
MRTYTAVRPPEDDADREERGVHEWRVSRLIRLGVAEGVAEAVADRIDWHDVARLVEDGCPAPLAVAIIE